MENFVVYLEVGQKRTFAGALDWPGWCRSGADEDSALRALLDYGPRYAKVTTMTGLDYEPPAALAAFTIVERLAGSSTTDFGAPDAAPARDSEPVDEDDFAFFQDVLGASWQALDSAVESARGKTLRLGPRGGGRDLDRIVDHVRGGQVSYLRQLGWKPRRRTKRIFPGSRRRFSPASPQPLRVKFLPWARVAACAGRPATSSAARSGTSSTMPGRSKTA